MTTAVFYELTRQYSIYKATFLLYKNREELEGVERNDRPTPAVTRPTIEPGAMISCRCSRAALTRAELVII
jgi:hypothetical protein